MPTILLILASFVPLKSTVETVPSITERVLLFVLHVPMASSTRHQPQLASPPATPHNMPTKVTIRVSPVIQLVLAVRVLTTLPVHLVLELFYLCKT